MVSFRFFRILRVESQIAYCIYCRRVRAFSTLSKCPAYNAKENLVERVLWAYSHLLIVIIQGKLGVVAHIRISSMDQIHHFEIM